MANPVKIVVILAARPGKADALKALLFGMLAPTRAELGNIRWDLWQDQADPTRFVIDELYTDNAAVAAHRETPHFLNYFAQINDLAERTPFVLDPVDVA
jgi:quinol monooxygenase YgiN